MSGQLSFLTEEIKKLQSKHATRVRTLKQHNFELSQAVELLQKREGSLRKDLEVKSNEVVHLRSATETLQREIENVNEKKETEVATLTEKLGLLKIDLHRAEKIAKESEAKLSQQLHEESNASDEQMKESQSRLSELSRKHLSEVKEYEQQLAQLKEENVFLQRKHEKIEAYAEESAHRVSALEDIEAQLKTELELKGNEMKSLALQVEKSTKAYGVLEKDLEEIAEENSRLSRENGILTSRLEDADSSTDSTALNQRIEELEEQLQESKTTLNSRDQEIERLQKQEV